MYTASDGLPMQSSFSVCLEMLQRADEPIEIIDKSEFSYSP